MESGQGTKTASTSRVVLCETCGKRNRVRAIAQGVPRCSNCHSALPWIAEADDATFEAVTGASVPVLVDLWATWCGPCRAVSPALEEVAQRLAGRLKLVKVDVDASPGTSQRFEVRAVPTLLVLKDGEVIGRQAGAASARVLEAWVERTLSGVPG